MLRFAVSSLVLVLACASTLKAQLSPQLQRSSLGVTRPSSGQQVKATAWLTLPGQAALEQGIAERYNPQGQNYGHFYNWQELTAFLPTADQIHALEAELTAGHLTVVSADPHRRSVSFSGTISDFESVFHTTVQLHTLASGTQVRALTSAPHLVGAALPPVLAVTGISETPEEPASVISGEHQSLKEAAANAHVPGPFYCFSQPTKTLLATPDQSSPTAVYAGPVYGSVNGGLATSRRCGYTPAQMFAQSGLGRAHAAGFTGKGQTIAILEEVGSPTIASDLRAFDQLYGLPAANLKVVDLTTTPGTPTVGETTLDVEWAHAVAPDAQIIVINTDRTNLRGGLAYVLNHRLADTVSISYAASELTSSADNALAWNQELMFAAALGVNVNVCTQDYGDYAAAEGSRDVAVPADSPYATAVGGLSIFYQPGSSDLFKTSWGNDFTRVGDSGIPLATPQQLTHGTGKFGGGGGLSTIFPIPSYQSALGGSSRHLPDVSDYADPYTGLTIVITDPACAESPCVEVTGGTSLATPIFAGKWALLNQRYGASLGQAAPFVAAHAGTPAIEDIVPKAGLTVFGDVLEGTAVTLYTAAQLAQPQTGQPFSSAVWQAASSIQGYPVGTDFVVSFGTDSSLVVRKGYDDATGWGQLDILEALARVAD